MPKGNEALTLQLAEIERSIKSDILEFRVGVNHASLDEERERNCRIREKLESVLASLESLRTKENVADIENAKRLLKVTAGNTDTLRYLESVSCLEGIFTDVTKAATVTAVDLSREEAISQRVLSTRLLSENVEQCWEYASKLSGLATLHLKAASDFHQYNHSINEIRAHCKRIFKESGACLQAFAPEGRISEASKLALEMENRLKVYASLADRAKGLVAKSRSIVPVANRLINVKNGKAEGMDEPLMVQMLMTHVGTHHTLQKGESLQLLDTTESPYLWKVKTSKGSQYIPSIICIVASSNKELVADALSTEAEIIESWRESLKNYRKQLAAYYYMFLKNISSVSVTDLEKANKLLDEINSLLVRANSSDEKLGDVVAKLRRQIHPHGTSRQNGTEEVWNRSEITILRQSLQHLQEHEQQLRHLERTSGQMSQDSKDYFAQFSKEAREMTNHLESLQITHDQNRADLKDLYDRVQNWKTVYEESIGAPKRGVGRLILSRLDSSLENSSGVSSDEVSTNRPSSVPRPPSPYGRITVRPLLQERDTIDFLESRSQLRSHKTLASSTDGSEESQNLNVFSGGANLCPVQVETAVSVKKKAPMVTTSAANKGEPKFVRDVATQILVVRKIRHSQTELHGDLANCRYASSQKDQRRVDCVTQIGVLKAAKEQQVNACVINAAMQASEARFPTPLTGETQAISSMQHSNFATIHPTVGAVSFTSGRAETRDLQTQVGEISKPPRGLFQTESAKANICDIGVRPVSIDSANLQFSNLPAVIPGDFATKIVNQSEVMTQANPIMAAGYTSGKQRDLNSAALETSMHVNSIATETEMPDIKSINFSTHIPKPFLVGVQQKSNTTVGNFRQTVQPITRQEYQVEHSGRPEVSNAQFSTMTRAAFDVAVQQQPNTAIGTVHQLPRSSGYSEFQVDHSVPANAQFSTTNPVSCDFGVQKQPNGAIGYVNQGAPQAAQAAFHIDRNDVENSMQTQNTTAFGEFATAKRETAYLGQTFSNEPISDQFQVTNSISLNEMNLEVLGGANNVRAVGFVESGKQLGNTSVAPSMGWCTCQHGANISSTNVCNSSVPGNLSSTQARQYGSSTEMTTSYTSEPRVITLEAMRHCPVHSQIEVPLKTASQQFAWCQTQTAHENLSAQAIEYFDRTLAKHETKSICCQVGTILLPKQIKVSTVQMNVNDKVCAQELGVPMKTILCPASIEVTPLLTSRGGIEIVDLKEVGNVDMQTEYGSFTAEVQKTKPSHSDTHASKSRLCVLEFTTSDRDANRGTISSTMKAAQGSFARQILTKSECQFQIKGSDVERSIITTRRCPSCHTDISKAYPEISHGVNSTPCVAGIGLSNASKPTFVACSTQVGTVLTPTSIHVADIKMRARNLNTAKQMNVNVDSIICPSTVKMTPKLTDTAGIQVTDIRDISNVDICIQNAVYEADVGTGAKIRSTGAVSSRGREICKVSLKQNPTGEITLGETAVETHFAKDIAQSNECYSLRDIGCELNLREMRIENACFSCQGTGRQIGASDLPIPIASSTLISKKRSSTRAGLNIANVSSKSVECQVGIVLKPKTVQVANLAIQTMNASVASELGIQVNAILCPASIGFESVLTENAGVQMLDFKKVNAIEVQTQDGIYAAEVQSSSRETAHTSTKPKQVNQIKLEYIGSAKSGKEQVKMSESFNIKNMDCTFAVNPNKIGALCTGCDGSGRILASAAIPSCKYASSTTTGRKPVEHLSISASEKTSVQCQVGAILRPVVVQVANMKMKVNSTQIAEEMGLQANAVVCPAALQIQTELADCQGIQVVDVRDVDSIEVQAGSGIYSAQVEAGYGHERYELRQTGQRWEGNQANIASDSGRRKLSQAFSMANKTTIAGQTGSREWKDGGCSFVLRDGRIGDVCMSCHGSGQAAGRLGLSANSEVRTQAQTSSKTCQVGALLLPSMLQVSKVEMAVENRQTASILGLPMDAIVRPSTLEMQTVLIESSGIQISEMKPTETVDLQVGEHIYRAQMEAGKAPVIGNTLGADEKRLICCLEIKSGILQTTIGSTPRYYSQSTKSVSRYDLNDIGCSLKVQEGAMIPMCANCRRSNTSIQLVSATENKAVCNLTGRSISCQVGTMLLPKTVQVADMEMNVNVPRIANSLGLKPNAILCPSTIDLESQLTETSGIHVMDIRDVKEVGICMGKTIAMASLEARKSSVRSLATAFEPKEPCYLNFQSRQASSTLNSIGVAGKFNENIAFTTGKMIDQNAGCTFRVRQTTNIQGQDQLHVLPLSQSSQKSFKSIQSTGREASSQVGILMLPSAMRITGSDGMSGEKSRVCTTAVGAGKTIHPSVFELETRIAETSGINVVSVNEMRNMTIQVGTKSYPATIEICEQSSQRPLASYGRSTHQTLETWTPSVAKYGQAQHANRKTSLVAIKIPQIGALLQASRMKTASETMLEITGISTQNQRMRLRIPVDLQTSFQTALGSMGVSVEPPVSGFLEVSHPAHIGIPHNKLNQCDVACEALIRPITLEKRLQTII